MFSCYHVDLELATNEKSLAALPALLGSHLLQWNCHIENGTYSHCAVYTLWLWHHHHHQDTNCSSPCNFPLASSGPSLLPLSFPSNTGLFFCHYSLAYISWSFISIESLNMWFSLVSNYFSLSSQTSSLLYPPHPLAKVPGVGWFSACPLLTEDKRPLVQLLSSVVNVN